MTCDEYIWHTEVRGYELDNQSIVNNANYLHYFDHARVKYLLSLGIDYDDYAKRGFNFVVAEVNMAFKLPLRAHDKFYVATKASRSGRILITFHQKIIRETDQKLMTTAESKVTCFDVIRQRPCMPDKVIEAFFATQPLLSD